MAYDAAMFLQEQEDEFHRLRNERNAAHAEADRLRDRLEAVEDALVAAVDGDSCSIRIKLLRHPKRSYSVIIDRYELRATGAGDTILDAIEMAVEDLVGE